MKAVSLLLVLAAAATVFAASPESLSGVSYRSYVNLSGVTNVVGQTAILRADGRYVALAAIFGVRNGVVRGAEWPSLREPRADGRYEYRKTGEFTGNIVFTPDTGAPFTESLTFTTPTSGTIDFAGFGSGFSVANLADRETAPVSNVSLRGRVDAGRPLIMGFTVPGTASRELLVRVIGPSLTSVGVTGAWQTSSLQLYRGDAAVFGDAFRFPFWSAIAPPDAFPGGAMTSPEAGLRTIFSYLGAFPLPSGSKDSAIVIRLAPGSYTVVATAEPGDPGGEALLEMFALP